MGKTIVRVLAGTELSPELSSQLEKLLPGHSIEFFNNKPNYKDSIRQRIHSLYTAFLFILDAYPLPPHTRFTKQGLSNHAKQSLLACTLASDSLGDLHDELEQFTSALVNALLIGWQWPSSANSLDAAIGCLNEAEQYVIMREGRPDIATLTPMNFGAGSEYLLQWDESLPPYTAEWLGELQQIKAAQSFVTPPWFRTLSEYQYTYLFYLPQGVSAEKVIVELESVLHVLSNAKKIASNWSLDLQKINEKKSPFPDWFTNLSKAMQGMIRVLAQSFHAVFLEESIEKFIGFLQEKNTEPTFHSEFLQVMSLPMWYLLLSKHQQSFLNYVLKDTDDLKQVVSFLPSRHRTLPVPANFGRHSILRINEQGELQTLSAKRYRSSHISSRDLLKANYPKVVQEQYCLANLQQVMSYAKPQQRILKQTLISPIPVIDSIPKSVLDFMPELPPDLSLFQQARSVVAQSKYASRIVQGNHPLNSAKYIYYTQADNSDSLDLIAHTEDVIKNLIRDIELTVKEIAAVKATSEDLTRLENEVSERLSMLQAHYAALNEQKANLVYLVKEYQKVLHSSYGSATLFDYYGRELFLSSLEQLIILNQDGYSYGSCVSGKDRKAIELMHTDAMIVYKLNYGCWPSFADPALNRLRFVDLVATLYMSRHQHRLAGQNAPGSEGIKTPERYLPKDIYDEINRRLGSVNGLKSDDRLASDNEVKKISLNLHQCTIKKNELQAALITTQLGEALCTQLYDWMLAMLNEKHLFKPRKNKLGLFKVAQELPKGIEDIKCIMKEPSAGNTNIERLNKIIVIVSQRPKEESSRTTATKTVYEGIRGLYEPSLEHPDLIQYTIELVQKFKTLFDNSKAERERIKEQCSSDEETPSPK